MEKLNNAIGGIRTMSNLPDLVIVLDTVKDKIAVQEAFKLKIPVMGIIDTNSEPELINYPIPGNDDAIRSIELYVNLFAETILEAKKNIKDGSDVGKSFNPPKELNITKTIINTKDKKKKITKEKNKK